MKKLNNKGITLIELIVSFAIVSVAILYFYQTIHTVTKLYSVSRKETNKYVEVNYVYRFLDQKVINSINSGSTDKTRLCNQSIIYKKVSDYLGATNDDILKKYTILECSKSGSKLNIKFADEKEKEYWYTKYVDALAFDDSDGSEPGPVLSYKMVKANGTDPATYNETSGWYYDTSPTLKVTIDKNGGPDIKKFEKCENNNCTDITDKVVNNIYTEANLKDDGGTTVVFKATNTKGKETQIRVTYKIDTVPPRFVYKAFLTQDYSGVIFGNEVRYYFNDENYSNKETFNADYWAHRPACSDITQYYDSNTHEKLYNTNTDYYYNEVCPINFVGYRDTKWETTICLGCLKNGDKNEITHPTRAHLLWASSDRAPQILRVRWYDNLSGFGRRKITYGRIINGEHHNDNPSDWAFYSGGEVSDGPGGDANTTQYMRIYTYCDLAGNCFKDKNGVVYGENNTTRYVEISDNAGWPVTNSHQVIYGSN